MTEKRYTAKIEMFIFETDDKMAEMLAKSIAKDIDRKYDNQACLVEIRHQPFGQITEGKKLNT